MPRIPQQPPRWRAGATESTQRAPRWMLGFPIRTVALVLSALLSASACERNPCPAGSSPDRAQARCIERAEVEDAAVTEPTTAADDGAPDADEADLEDGGQEPEAAEAAASPAPDDDAGDESPELDASDASALDANDADVSEASVVEAGQDGGPASDCESNSLAAWRNFQVSPAMADATRACGGSLASCTEPGCELVSCMREQAHVSSCERCLTEEARCVARHCSNDCGSGGSASACLGCACFSRCFVAEGSCGMGPSDLCAACNQGRCGTWWAENVSAWWSAEEELPTGNRGALQPVAISRAPRSIETFFINEDGSLGEVSNDGADRTLGTNVQNLGAPRGVTLINGSLAVAAWRADPAHLIARGNDNRLWHRTLRGSSFSDWDNPLETAHLRPDDRLSIIARGAHLRDAVFADADGKIHCLTWDDDVASMSALGAPEGVRLSGPHLASRNIDVLDVVALGDDRRIYHKRLERGVWSRWDNPRGITADAPPQIVAPTPVTVDILWYQAQAEGGVMPIQRTFWVDGSWLPVVSATWEPLADWLLDVPTVRSFGFARLDACGRFGVSSLFHFTIDARAWYWDSGLSVGNVSKQPVSLVSWDEGHFACVYGMGLGQLGAIMNRR